MDEVSFQYSGNLYYSEAQTEIEKLTYQMRRNSERWFPDLHTEDPNEILKFYTLGLIGEAGEVANEVKKWMRGSKGLEHLGEELADVFTYLLLLAGQANVNLVHEYTKKMEKNERRWGNG